MIQISRLTQPSDVTELLPHVTLPDASMRDLFAQQLTQMMIQRPEAVNITVAISDINGLMGFTIADLGIGQVVNLRQAWVSPKANPELDLAHELQTRLMLWTVANNRSQIEVRTERSAEALYRRFGFEETAKILTQHIPEEFTQDLLNSLKEPANG